MTSAPASAFPAEGSYLIPGHPAPQWTRGRVFWTVAITLFAVLMLLTERHDSGLYPALIVCLAALVSGFLLHVLPPHRTWLHWWIAYLPWIALLSIMLVRQVPVGQVFAAVMLFLLTVFLPSNRISSGRVAFQPSGLLVEWPWIFKTNRWLIPYADIDSVVDADPNSKQYQNKADWYRPTVYIHTRTTVVNRKGERHLDLHIDRDDLAGFRRQLASYAPTAAIEIVNI